MCRPALGKELPAYSMLLTSSNKKVGAVDKIKVKPGSTNKQTNKKNCNETNIQNQTEDFILCHLMCRERQEEMKPCSSDNYMQIILLV